MNGEFSSLFLLTIDICYFHLSYSAQCVLLWAGKGAADIHLLCLNKGLNLGKVGTKMHFKSLEYINCFIH